MANEIEAYDVLQVRKLLEPGLYQWQDFSTIRTKDDIAFAIAIVKSGSFAGEAGEFRIVKQFPFTVKLTRG